MNPRDLEVSGAADIRQRVLSGLGWRGATQLLAQVLQFGISVILARLLSPSDFGLMGMVLVFTGFASSLSDLGLGASLIQRQTASDRHLNAVFWVNVAAGTLLTISFALLAPLIARFYGEPLLKLLTSAIALNFLLASLNIVQNALLNKSLDFHAQFRIDTVALVGSGVVALAFALAGFGVWSLVGQAISLNAIRVTAMWHASSWRPTLSFDASALRELMQFGRPMMAFGIVYYWGTNFDKLVMGRALGSSALGIYSVADKLMRLPVTNVTDITSAVMFPALSAMQDALDSVRRAYLRATRMIALLTFPMMIGLAVLAEPAILVVYGEKWRETISVLQLLCIAGMAHSVYFTGGWIFLSRGRPDLLLRWGSYAALVRVVGILIGIRWGILGAAWTYVVASCVLIMYPTWASAGRLLHLPFRDLLRNVTGPLYCALTMGALLFFSEQWIFAGQELGLRLGIQVSLGVIIYGVLIRYFRLEAWEDLRGVIFEMGGQRSRLVGWLCGTRSTGRT